MYQLRSESHLYQLTFREPFVSADVPRAICIKWHSGSHLYQPTFRESLAAVCQDEHGRATVIKVGGEESETGLSRTVLTFVYPPINIVWDTCPVRLRIGQTILDWKLHTWTS